MDQWHPRRFATNVVVNVLALVFRTCARLWFVPFLIRHLDVGLFGLIALATSVSAQLNVLITSLNTAIGRFFTIDLYRKQSDAANQTFNTGFWTAAAIGALLLPLVVAIAVLAPRVFSVPQGHETSTRWLFAGVLTAYVVGLIRGVFSASAFARNRLDLRDATVMIDVFGRILIVVALFSIATPSLAWVGLGTAAAAIIALIVAVLIWRALTPEIELRPRHYRWSRFREMAAIGGWHITNHLGVLLLRHIDLIVINIFLGTEAGGRYGCVLQLALVLRLLSRTAGGTLAPVVMASYAKGDAKAFALLCRRAVRMLGLGMAFPVAVVAGLSSQLLRVWLGEEFSGLATLTTVLTAHLCINLAVLPLMHAQLALKSVRWPALATLISGAVNVALAVWWVRWGRDGLGVAIAGALMLTIKNAVFVPLYAAHIQNTRWHTFFGALLPGVAGCAAIALALRTVAGHVALDSWASLLCAVGIGGAVYACCVYFAVLSPSERQLLGAILTKRGAGSGGR